MPPRPLPRLRRHHLGRLRPARRAGRGRVCRASTPPRSGPPPAAGGLALMPAGRRSADPGQDLGRHVLRRAVGVVDPQVRVLGDQRVGDATGGRCSSGSARGRARWPSDHSRSRFDFFSASRYGVRLRSRRVSRSAYSSTKAIRRPASTNGWRCVRMAAASSGEVERPDQGEDQVGVGGRGLLEHPLTELAEQPVERRRPEVEDVEQRLDRVVVVEEPEAARIRDRAADRHLADGRRAEHEQQRHAPRVADAAAPARLSSRAAGAPRPGCRGGRGRGSGGSRRTCRARSSRPRRPAAVTEPAIA